MVCHILLFGCSISPFFNKIPLALLFFCACNSMIYSFFLLGIYVLSFLSQFLYLNMFCISLWGIYVFWFPLLAPLFSFSPVCFFSYLFVFLFLSACVSLIFCCLYVGRHTTCTTAVVQFVPQSSYNVYGSRRTLSKSAHSIHY